MKMVSFEGDKRFRAYTGKTEICGDTVSITVCLDDDELVMNDETAAKAEETMLKAAKEIAQKADFIKQSIVTDDMISLAEDWASSAEEDETSDRECYIMEDGQKVFFPITNEDFTKSLHIAEAGVDVDKDFGYEEITVYFECSPDYFAGHSLEVIVDPDGTVEEPDLVG